MESNFQKCTFLESGAGGPRTEKVCRCRAKPIEERYYCWEIVVEDMLHNAEVVVHYEIMNSYVPSMCVQAGWYRSCNTDRQTMGVLSSWHDLERKIYCWNWVGRD